MNANSDSIETDVRKDDEIAESYESRVILRPLIQRVFRKSWILCLLLYVIFFIIRGVGCLGPEKIRILILVGFILMWPLPFIFYNRKGWKDIGIKKIEKPLWLLWGLLIGAGAAMIVYFIGWGLFGAFSFYKYKKIEIDDTNE